MSFVSNNTIILVGHVSPEEQCTICLDSLNNGESSYLGHYYSFPVCHVFHATCLNKWLERTSSCPCCRLDLQRPSVERAVPLFGNNRERGEELAQAVRDENLNTFEELLALGDIPKDQINTVAVVIGASKKEPFLRALEAHQALAPTSLNMIRALIHPDGE